MKNRATALNALVNGILGQQLVAVEVHDSHGEVLELIFENGRQLSVCSTHGICDKSVKDNRDHIYVSLDEKSL